MKETHRLLLIVAFSFIAVLPSVSLVGLVYAQDRSFTIDRVDHQIQVMYSGHMLIVDTIHFSGQIPESFVIGLPLKYSVDVMKAFAYDKSHSYTMNLGVPLGDRGAFYACEIDFGGNQPNVFTVAFVLSNRRIEEGGGGNFTLDYPAYPSLSQKVGTCNVTVSFPSTPTSVSISKDGQDVNTVNYLITDLAAYTYSIGQATVQVPLGSLQLITINGLDRQVNIDPKGELIVEETYNFTSKSNVPLSQFVLSLPFEATNIAVRDEFGNSLYSGQPSSRGDKVLLANTTLTDFVDSGQSTMLAVTYNLPSAILVKGQYTLIDFDFFPNYQYLVDHATVTLNLPEGGTILVPDVSELGSSSTLIRRTFQDTLIVTQDSISYADNLTPQKSSTHLMYSYNPIWISFRPTFWAALIGTGCCVGAFAYRKIRPKEQTYRVRSQELADQPIAYVTSEAVKAGQPINLEALKAFLGAYESKRLAVDELKALDVQAQKGKIQRRQYKIQRNNVETRLSGLLLTIDRWRAMFLGAGGPHADMVRQLDLAEADLVEAEENIKVLKDRQHRGEISLEAYKRSVMDYQKMSDKADSAINAILARLREKIRRAT